MSPDKIGKVRSRWWRIRFFARDSRGNIATITALLILPLAALIGMASEGGGWFLITRAMQNAADSAVIAAATNGGNAATGSTDYVNEGKAVATSSRRAMRTATAATA